MQMSNLTFQDFLPQGEEITMLQTLVCSNKMPHALLITGEKGTGKRTLSQILAASLLCINKGKRPCGICRNCTRAYTNEHPDMILIEKGTPLVASEAKKSKTTIPIDDIREMIRLSSAHPFEGGNRIIQIINAEDMTTQAQNCLLKILEEPPENTYFILTSSHPELLLQTIKSRCRFFKMKPWDEEQIIRILVENGINKKKAYLAARACNGSIGYAKQLADDENYWKMREEIITDFFINEKRSNILSVSSHWKENKTEIEQLFSILEECIHIMLTFRITKKEDDRLNDFSNEWKYFAANADPERFVILLDRISECRKQCGFNVNIQAIVEQLFLSLMGESQK